MGAGQLFQKFRRNAPVFGGVHRFGGQLDRPQHRPAGRKRDLLALLQSRLQVVGVAGADPLQIEMALRRIRVRPDHVDVSRRPVEEARDLRHAALFDLRIGVAHPVRRDQRLRAENHAVHRVIVQQRLHRARLAHEFDEADLGIGVPVKSGGPAGAENFADRRLACEGADFFLAADGFAHGFFDGSPPVLQKLRIGVPVADVAAADARAGVGVRRDEHDRLGVERIRLGQLHTQQTARQLAARDHVGDDDHVAAAPVVEGEHPAVKRVADPEVAPPAEGTETAEFGKERHLHRVFRRSEPHEFLHRELSSPPSADSSRR